MMTSCLCPGSQIRARQDDEEEEEEGGEDDLLQLWEKESQVGIINDSRRRGRDSKMSCSLSLTVIRFQCCLFAFLSIERSHRRWYSKSFKRRRKSNQMYAYERDSMFDKASESAAVCQYFMLILEGGGTAVDVSECERWSWKKREQEKETNEKHFSSFYFVLTFIKGPLSSSPQ